MTAQTLSRRTFIRASVAVGGGLMLCFHMPQTLAATIGPRPQSTTSAVGTEVNAWIVIDRDGTVTLRIPHTEMGQGGITSVTMLIAEELNVDWSKIKTEFADANRHLRNNKEYKVMSTHGSQLVRLQHPHLMGAGASARERLKEAAAQAWGVDRSQIEAKLGVLTAGDRTGTYGEFAEAAAKVKLDKEPGIETDPAKWWLLGKPRQRLDIPNKVNGSAQYAIDTRVPGMVYAAVKASPVPWGTLKSYNFDAIKDRPGVIAAVQLKAVPGKRDQPDLQDAVAVVADSWYRAKTALELLPIEWESGDSVKAKLGRLFRRRPPADGGEGPHQRKGRPQGGRDHRCRQEARDGILPAPVRDPCPHGADQRHRACAGRSRRCVVADAGSVGGGPIGCQPARGRPENGLCAHHVPGRRVRRQRRRRYRGDASGGPDLQAGRQAREGDLAARGRPGAGQAASARRGQARSRHRRRRAAHCAAHARGLVLHRRDQSDRRRDRRLRHLQHALLDSASSARAAQRQDSHPESRPIARPAPISWASWPSPLSTRWPSPADGIRSNGASR